MTERKPWEAILLVFERSCYTNCLLQRVNIHFYATIKPPEWPWKYHLYLLQPWSGDGFYFPKTDERPGIVHSLQASWTDPNPTMPRVVSEIFLNFFETWSHPKPICHTSSLFPPVLFLDEATLWTTVFPGAGVLVILLCSWTAAERTHLLSFHLVY